MRTVRDDEDRRLLVVKRSSEASLVRDPSTGEERYVANDRLEPLDGADPLEVAASGVPEGVRNLCTAVRDRRSLGLALVIADRESIAVRELLEHTELCESDLLGQLSEFRAAGLVEETTMAGERGYRATRQLTDAVERLRSAGDRPADEPGTEDRDDRDRAE